MATRNILLVFLKRLNRGRSYTMRILHIFRRNSKGYHKKKRYQNRYIRIDPKIKSGMAYINQIRKEYHLSPLRIDDRALKLAYHRADDMAKGHYFAHENPRTGVGPLELASKFGFQKNEYPAENIFMGSNNIYTAIDAWMHSPEHKHNLLDNHIGGAIITYRRKAVFIGVLKAEKGWYFR